MPAVENYKPLFLSDLRECISYRMVQELLRRWKLENIEVSIQVEGMALRPRDNRLPIPVAPCSNGVMFRSGTATKGDEVDALGTRMIVVWCSHQRGYGKQADWYVLLPSAVFEECESPS